MKKVKVIIAALAIVFVIIQFIRPARNQNRQVSGQSLAFLYHPSDSVVKILQAACLDCHSDNTHYPWYTNVQPLGWFLNRHIREGKDELNFDEFGAYSTRRQKSKLRSIKDQIVEQAMPLKSYELMHPESRLSSIQKQTLIHWLDKQIDSLEQQ